MANPVVVKTVVGIAVKAASDEKTRTRILTVILAPVIFTLLLTAFVLYLVTSPLSAFASFLDEDELELVEEFQIGYGYNQNIGIHDNDYITGSGQNYDGVVFGEEGDTQVTYFSQLDERWAGAAYGSSTVSRSGCGPASMSIVVSTLTDMVIDPPHMAGWAYSNGYYCEGNGSYHSLIPGAAEHYGLSVEGDLSAQGIVDALVDGKLVVAIMAKGHFTKGGHFIVLRGVTGSGKILVADSASIDRSRQDWDLSIILGEARKGAGQAALSGQSEEGGDGHDSVSYFAAAYEPSGFL